MKLPKKLTILGIPHKLIYFDDGNKVDSNDSKYLYGQLCNDDGTMRVLRGKRPIEDIWQTIWHEVIHSIWGQLGTHRKMKEADVDALSTAINDFMWRNKLNAKNKY